MKNNSPYMISTEITSEKIKTMNNIDLNALFNLNYNFDLLKGIIEQLLKNQNLLQNQINDINKIQGEKDKRIQNLEKEVKYLKETYVTKSEFKILENDLKAIRERLNKHDIQIDDILKKLKLIEDKINQIEIKINKLEKNGISKDDLDKIKKELENLKKEHENTVINVNKNKEQIDIILGKLNDIENDYKQGDEKLQKEIDELKQKLEILLKLPKGEGKSDLEAINDLMKKILNLENNFNDFVEKVNIEEIYRQLKELYEIKADKKDLDELKDKHKEDIEAINKRIDNLFSTIMSKSGSGEQPIINFDSSQYVLKFDFEKYKKENQKEIKKIWDEIENLKNLISQIFDMLKKKANLSDLEDLKNFLLGKIEELALASVKKFADKNETTNNFKYLEDQIKKILENMSSQKVVSEADTWLLAKKPINAYSCASCENYIGDLREDSHKFIPWNKMPLRDPGDKLYRMGNGFSKMLQMLNFDNNGNMSLSPNIINEVTNNSINESHSRVNSAVPNLNNMINTGNNNMRAGGKKRIQSAKPKIRMELKNLKKNMTINNINSNSNLNMDKNGDEYISEITKSKGNNELYPDIYKNQKIENNNDPKIMKIIRKTANNKFGNNKDSKENSD